MSSEDPVPSGPEADIIHSILSEIDASDFRRVEYFLSILIRQGATQSGYPTTRPQDCRKIVNLIHALFGTYRNQLRTGNIAIVDRFEALLSAFARTDIKYYPNEILRLQLLQAEIKLLRQDPLWVRNTIGRYADAIYSVEADFDHVKSIWKLDGFARIMAGDITSISSLYCRRILVLARLSPISSWQLFSEYAAFLGTGRLPIANGVTAFAIHRIAALVCSLRRSRGNIWHASLARLAIYVLITCGGLIVWWTRHIPDLSWTKSSLRFREALVTRSMGGIGDLLMMTPGLRALARRQGKPVKLIVPRQFFPVFENNPFVELIDMAGPVVDVAAFRRWHNLSACPAAAYESARRPYVKKGRVELFARGMRVGRWRLWRHGWNIELRLNETQVSFRDRFVRDRGLGRYRPLIGVQPYSRDTYKDHAGIVAIIEKLADTYDILLFHHVDLGLPPGNNIASTVGLTLSQSFALVSALQVMVSIDSAFLHAAAALDIPVVAIFGPTDGKMFTRHVRKVTVLNANDAFPCAPCWRNEDLPCELLGQVGYSPCISAISYERISASIAELIRNDPAPAAEALAQSGFRSS
jgi:ADP-heptose:LPS heptosyltransferase